MSKVMHTMTPLLPISQPVMSFVCESLVSQFADATLHAITIDSCCDYSVG